MAAPLEGHEPDPPLPGPVFSALTAFFETDEWVYEPMEGQLALQMPFEGKNARWM